MSVERLAAACLLPSFPGPDAPDWVLHRLDGGLGGITLFADNIQSPEQLAALTTRLRGTAEILLALDEEGGDVTRLEAAGGSSYPGNLALGVVDDVELTRDVASAIAARLAAVGVNVNFAPVADVNEDPHNPVIGVRSFGSDPELVARHVAAFVEGTQRHGVAACAKHFPGHGNTSVDSHLALPVVEGDLDAALLPFRAAIASGVQAVMAGHLVVPALDPEPATVSRRILTGLLREELGFEGLVVTDALEMRALSGTVGVEEAAVRALAAGADTLCVGHDLHDEAVASIVRALVEAVSAGRLSLGRLENAAARVAAAATLASAPSAADVPTRPVGLEAARRALRVRDTPSFDRDPLVVEFVPDPNIAAGKRDFGLADLWPRAIHLRVHEGSPDPAEALAAHPELPLVVVTRDAVRHEWQQARTWELLALRPDAVVVETGVPGGVPAAIETHGAARVSLEAAVELLAATRAGY